MTVEFALQRYDKILSWKKINFAEWGKCCTFAVAFESESSKQEKHCDCPYTEISPKFVKEERADALRLICMHMGVLTSSAY
jgi:hypothetical protein